MNNTSSDSQKLIEEIKARQLFYQTTDGKEVTPITGVYCGFDATAISLQIGNLLCISLLRLFDNHNVPTIALLGGATTRAGDPVGKMETRKKLANAQIDENLNGIKAQLKRLIPNAKILNNASWLDELKFTHFLELVAHHTPVSALLKLETFATRLKNNDPLNMQELLYPLMQGYDFLWLYEHENCNAEFGGADQWCNVLAGVDLIKKKHEDAKAVGLTIPLLTTPDGKKMGKSVSGAIYLDENLCSPYDFWQFWRNIDDSLAKPCLKKFTLIDIEEIDTLNDINQAKIMLANDITTWIHGSDAARNAETQAKSVFVERNLENLQAIEVVGNKLVEIMVQVKACETNSQAKTLIEQNAVKIDDIAITEKTHAIKPGEHSLSVGKKKFYKIIVA